MSAPTVTRLTALADVVADLPTQYAPAAVEGPLYQRWLDLGVFDPDHAPTGADDERLPYSIVLPPPNVTGSLHVGHALNHTVMDVLTRWRRMQGRAVLWLPGTDHAAIAVETLLTRQLEAEGTSKAEVGREELLRRAWEWRDTHGGRILAQMRRLGDGVDWSRLAFTLDERVTAAVREAFKRLFDAGLVYRAERLVNWSPVLGTAVSDIEVEHREVDGELVTLDYGSGVHVATTRVETMLGDTAVAVHPDDERYTSVIGTTLTLPIVGRQIPVVADEHVDPAFGTGAVKVTPAHDPNDLAIAQRHDLPAITIMDEQARIAGTGTRFDGLDRYDARREVKEELRRLGLVVAEKAPYPHSVAHSERSGEAIEPRLSLQWWVRVAPLAQAAGDAVRRGDTAFSPPEMADRFFGWVDDMHDWCVSRQLWWGHRVPIWYGPGGEVVCPRPGEEPTGEGWHQDPDVLDTWFSSALWPFATLGWPDTGASDLQRFYPTSVLVTGYDIIFFWVARMMMMGTWLADDLPGPVPFSAVALTGLVRDERGRKMSKSIGNVIDPLVWMDDYGTDAVRFGLLRGAMPGADVNASVDAVTGSRNFANKVWNATRFALLNGVRAGAPLPPREELAVVDRWVLSRLSAVVTETTAALESFAFSRYCEGLYSFAWGEVFDWYVEAAKVGLAAGGERAEGTRAVLGHVLDTLLRLLHPVMPFLADTLWPRLSGQAGQQETVVTAAWPEADPAHADPAAEAAFGLLAAAVTEARRVRSDQGVPSGRVLPAVLVDGQPGLADQRAELAALARLDLALAPAVPDSWVPAVTSGGTVGLDVSGAIDREAERARWAKELANADRDAAQNRARLSGPAADKAPPAVVAGWRTRLADAEGESQRLRRLLGGAG